MTTVSRPPRVRQPPKSESSAAESADGSAGGPASVAAAVALSAPRRSYESIWSLQQPTCAVVVARAVHELDLDQAAQAAQHRPVMAKGRKRRTYFPAGQGADTQVVRIMVRGS